MRRAGQARRQLARERDAVKAVVTFVTSREQDVIERLKRNHRGALAALAQIMMPEEASGDGTPGTPRLGHSFEAFRRRALAKARYFLHCRGQREITSWPDGRAAKRAQQRDGGCPATDALGCREHSACSI